MDQDGTLYVAIYSYWVIMVFGAIAAGLLGAASETEAYLDGGAVKTGRDAHAVPALVALAPADAPVPTVTEALGGRPRPHFLEGDGVLPAGRLAASVYSPGPLRVNLMI